MTKDEALKLALEKFEFMNHVDSIFEGEFNFQINAIKEALAQPEPWVELTNAEIGEIYRVGWANNMELARAIEAKLKEKNYEST